MNIIVCLDDNGGMLFNKRRQSRDSVLCDRVSELSKGSKLWMNEYSAKLFEKYKITVDECFFEKAAEGDFCFVEGTLPQEIFERAEKIIVYRWNRRYPSDVKFDLGLLNSRRLVSTFEFKGTSHEKITEEIFEL